MSELKGSKTEQNLKKALQGESLARNRYTFFAELARREGAEEVAKLFERLANNEMMHAKIWFKMLYDDSITSVADTLEVAAAGENGEWRSMYPQFAQTAREEGLEQVADLFERVAQIEKDHERTLLKSAISYVGSQAPAQEAPSTQTPPAADKREVPGYRCMFCGAVFEKRPDVCPVCKAIGSFESATLQV